MSLECRAINHTIARYQDDNAGNIMLGIRIIAADKGNE